MATAGLRWAWARARLQLRRERVIARLRVAMAQLLQVAVARLQRAQARARQWLETPARALLGRPRQQLQARARLGWHSKSDEPWKVCLYLVVISHVAMSFLVLPAVLCRWRTPSSQTPKYYNAGV
ncbi:uncharacterized protein [Triticum aestivum]|uniref:uncharacterized protein n=1 Tax=Triticum aestivum TaxID=4565 RepID=UPI00098A8104|nr:uncharacterized protein LOC109786799 [Aegilops tauschii subsp. strangulata]XP_044353677.1 uncharacterized protein LOC123075057 [Triticum aestivum]